MAKLTKEDQDKKWHEIIDLLREGRMLEHPGVYIHVSRALATGDFSMLKAYLDRFPTIMATARRNVFLKKKQEQENPYRPYPRPDEVAEYLNGPLKLGWVNEFDDQFGLEPSESTKIIIVVGSTGTGKSVFLKNTVGNSLTLDSRQWNLIVFDPEKREYRYLARQKPGLKVITRDRFLINPLARHPFLNLTEHIIMVMDVLVAEGYLGTISRNLLMSRLHLLYQKHETPTLAHLSEDIANLMIRASRDTFNFRDILWKIDNRLSAFLESGIFDCRKGILLEDVFAKEDIVLELDSLDGMVLNFVVSFIVRSLYLRNVRLGMADGKLKTLIVIEEASQMLQAEREIKDFGQSSLNQDLTRIRAAGLGTIIATQTPRSVSPTIRSLAGTKIAFKLTDGEDQKKFVQPSWNLTDEQVDQIYKFPTHGRAVVRFSGYPKAFELAVPPVDADHYVSREELASYMEAFWAELDSQTRWEPDGEQSNDSLFVELSSNASRILTHLGHHPFTRKSEIKDISGVTSRNLADQALNELENHGLITLEDYRTRGTSKAYYPVLTEKSWRWLQLSGPPGKGSYEHRLYQHVVKEYCQSMNQNPVIEGCMQNSSKHIDVLAQDENDRWIAYEVTLSFKNLLDNILQDFDAGVTEVEIVTRDVGGQELAMDEIAGCADLEPYLEQITCQVITAYS